jgi:hypothetical protein
MQSAERGWHLGGEWKSSSTAAAVNKTSTGMEMTTPLPILLTGSTSCCAGAAAAVAALPAQQPDCYDYCTGGSASTEPLLVAAELHMAAMPLRRRTHSVERCREQRSP